MAGKTIEEHMADFLMQMSGPLMRDYRVRCLAFWREKYGDATAAKVESMVRERYKS